MGVCYDCTGDTPLRRGENSCTDVCLANEATSSDINICDCNPEYYLNEDDLCEQLCNVENCDHCVEGNTETCDNCDDDGYYLNADETCSECVSGCKTCTNGDLCEACDDGMYMRDGLCSAVSCDAESEQSVLELPDAYFTCECKDDFMMVNDECIKCPDNCRYCTQEDNCLFCDFGFWMV